MSYQIDDDWIAWRKRRLGKIEAGKKLLHDVAPSPASTRLLAEYGNSTGKSDDYSNYLNSDVFLEAFISICND